MLQSDIALVVVSTDSYSDSWDVFFSNFLKYWKEFKGNKYLFTDSLNYDNYNVITINPNKGEFIDSLDWGGRLISCLKKIEENHILLVLEDYILISEVNNLLFYQMYNEFVVNNIDFLSIGTHDLSRVGHFNLLNDIVKVSKFSKYKITTAPGMWEKQLLLKYLDKGLNPWQFELAGTFVSWFRNDKIYMLNKMKFNLNYEIFPYFISNGLDSAIVRGKWQKGILPYVDKDQLLHINNRGFLESFGISKYDTFLKIFKKPTFLLGYFIRTILK